MKIFFFNTGVVTFYNITIDVQIFRNELLKQYLVSYEIQIMKT